MSTRNKGPDMNLIDKVIGYISPAHGFARAAWRSELQRQYDAGYRGGFNSDWKPLSGTAEQMNSTERDILRIRARDIERNADANESIILAFIRHVVGTGIKLQAKIKNSKGTEDEKLNAQVEELWEAWCKARNCDITGQQTFKEMCQMFVRRYIVDGGIILQKVYTGYGIVPFQIQAREVDDLDSTLYFTYSQTGNGNRVYYGIEMDPNNRPVAYYFKKYTPDGFYTGDTERIEAKNIIFLWDKDRPSQVREISKLARALPRIRDLNQFVEAVSIKERILACFSIFVKKMNPGGVGRSNSLTDNKEAAFNETKVSPGMISRLDPGDDIVVANPSGQASDATGFISTMQRLTGAGLGLSYEASSRDMSQVNYSSARQGLIEDFGTYGDLQDKLIDHICSEVYTEFFISAVLVGKLQIKDFWQNKEKYLKHIWIPPGMPWIDPYKEAMGNKIALETSQTTLERIHAKQGLDYKEVLLQRKREIEMINEYGLGGVQGGRENQKQ